MCGLSFACSSRGEHIIGERLSDWLVWLTVYHWWLWPLMYEGIQFNHRWLNWIKFTLLSVVTFLFIRLFFDGYLSRSCNNTCGRHSLWCVDGLLNPRQEIGHIDIDTGNGRRTTADTPSNQTSHEPAVAQLAHQRWTAIALQIAHSLISFVTFCVC